MVTIRHVDVGTLRVNASTGGVIGGDTDLLREIRNSIRGDDADPTVVQAIIQENRRLLHAITDLSDQLRGGGGGGTTGTTTGAGGGARGSGDTALNKIDDVLERLTRATVALEGGEKAGGGGDYFQRDVHLAGIANITRVFAKTMTDLDEQAKNTKGTFASFSVLVQREVLANLQGMAFGFQRFGLDVANVGAAFRDLRYNVTQQIVGMRESGVFGSNMLTPVQYLLEGMTRFREGILTSSDSFRTVLRLVSDSLQQGLISPLMATGKSVTELASDFYQARADMRGRGMDTRAFLNTHDADAHLASLVDLQLRFGQQAQVTDAMTTSMMIQDTNYLKIIASMTGETVGKLGEQLRASRSQEDILVGLGRLNADELKNFTQAQEMLTKLGPAGKALADQQAQMLAYGRSMGEITATNPEYAQMSIINGNLQTRMNLLETMMHNPSQVLQAAAPLGSAGVGGIFQSMYAPLQAVLGGFRNDQAIATVAGNLAFAKGTPTATQAGAQKDNSMMVGLEWLREKWEGIVTPFLTLERALFASTAALGINTLALLSAASKFGGGTGGIPGALLRGGGRVVGAGLGGAIGAGGAYMMGANETGVMGAGIGGMGGALLGSLISPGFGTAIGMAAGSTLGGYIGQMFQSSVPPPRNVAGAESGVNYGEQAEADMATAQLIPVNKETNMILYELLSETRRQTGMIAGGGTPEPARPAGAGFSSGQPARSMLNKADDSTPYTSP